MSVAPENGRNRIMIYGPKSDGTYIIEFRMADGEFHARLWCPTAVPDPKGCCTRQYADAVGSCSRPKGCCIRQHAGAVSLCSRPDAKAKGGQTLAVSWPQLAIRRHNGPGSPYLAGASFWCRTDKGRTGGR